jgi:hypothetical protein
MEVARKYIKFNVQKINTLNYLAGFFEGESSICLINQKCPSAIEGRTLVLCVSIGNTESDIILLYKELFSGSISKYKNRSRNMKPIYNWKVHSRIALNFCKIILPFLRTKRLLNFKSIRELDASLHLKNTGALKRISILKS